MPYADPERQRQYQRERCARLRSEWLEANGPCASCGSIDRLQVDHIDPTHKVSHNVWSWSTERREHELAKCQVLCFNCHRLKTRAAPYEHGNAKLTPAQIMEMRNLYAAGNITQRQLADRYGVVRSHVHRILHTDVWKDISGALG